MQTEFTCCGGYGYAQVQNSHAMVDTVKAQVQNSHAVMDTVTFRYRIHMF